VSTSTPVEASVPFFSTEGATGVYTCVIPDAIGTTRTLYIGVYNNGVGGWCNRNLS
jgi:hypothetical protein